MQRQHPLWLICAVNFGKEFRGVALRWKDLFSTVLHYTVLKLELANQSPWANRKGRGNILQITE